MMWKEKPAGNTGFASPYDKQRVFTMVCGSETIELVKGKMQIHLRPVTLGHLEKVIETGSWFNER